MIFKVQNGSKTVARFEEYREVVKSRSRAGSDGGRKLDPSTRRRMRGASRTETRSCGSTALGRHLAVGFTTRSVARGGFTAAKAPPFARFPVAVWPTRMRVGRGQESHAGFAGSLRVGSRSSWSSNRCWMAGSGLTRIIISGDESYGPARFSGTPPVHTMVCHSIAHDPAKPETQVTDIGSTQNIAMQKILGHVTDGEEPRPKSNTPVNLATQ
ncbi:hypothetical protein J5N97_000326 [Dioscorea zingiberensis]|uniref:Uncharacterized protein n=1 Tax=Dioscorea zingiberensis TaxID=325984 RepID=A0A9D5H1M9_9LILI|nr:hypothetical protein J5N97_000326 [Dioscorea zingiberensis]